MEKKIQTPKLGEVFLSEHLIKAFIAVVDDIKVDDANKRYKQLINYGIVVRNRSNVRGCENCLRVTVGTPQQNKILINTLKKI